VAPKVLANGLKTQDRAAHIYAPELGRLIAYAFDISNLWVSNEKARPTFKG
jgi:hypothetical protein